MANRKYYFNLEIDREKKEHLSPERELDTPLNMTREKQVGLSVLHKPGTPVVVYNAMDKTAIRSFEQNAINTLSGSFPGIVIISDSEVEGYNYDHVDLLVVRPGRVAVPGAPAQNSIDHPSQAFLVSLKVNIVFNSQRDNTEKFGAGTTQITSFQNTTWIDHPISPEAGSFAAYTEAMVEQIASTGIPGGATRIMSWVFSGSHYGVLFIKDFGDHRAVAFYPRNHDYYTTRLRETFLNSCLWAVGMLGD